MGDHFVVGYVISYKWAGEGLFFFFALTGGKLQNLPLAPSSYVRILLTKTSLIQHSFAYHVELPFPCYVVRAGSVTNCCSCCYLLFSSEAPPSSGDYGSHSFIFRTALLFDDWGLSSINAC